MWTGNHNVQQPAAWLGDGRLPWRRSQRTNICAGRFRKMPYCCAAKAHAAPTLEGPPRNTFNIYSTYEWTATRVVREMRLMFDDDQHQKQQQQNQKQLQNTTRVHINNKTCVLAGVAVRNEKSSQQRDLRPHTNTRMQHTRLARQFNESCDCS